MKELSIEEKARAYDEALKQVKECTSDENGFITIYPQEIFPTLKESEDEKIRKELITHCRNIRCVTEEGAEKIANWVAWLENQVEEKSDNKTKPKFKVGDWIIDNEDGKLFKVSKVRENTYRIVSQEMEEFDILRSIVENEYRKFTVEDAKHGYILSTEVQINELELLKLLKNYLSLNKDERKYLKTILERIFPELKERK